MITALNQIHNVKNCIQIFVRQGEDNMNRLSHITYLAKRKQVQCQRDDCACSFDTL